MEVFLSVNSDLSEHLEFLDLWYESFALFI
jgi:hypothetical protein